MEHEVGGERRRHERIGLERTTWSLVAALALVTSAWGLGAGLAQDWHGWIIPSLGCLALGAVLFAWRVPWPDAKMAALTACILQLVLFAVFGGCLQYLVAARKSPLWDVTFQAWDAALGLDWRAYLDWVNERPRLAAGLTLAYRSLIPQIVAVCMIVGLGGRLAALRTFTFAFVASGLACIGVSGLMPAMTVYAHLGLDPAEHLNLVPTLAHAHVAHLGAVREGVLPPLSPGLVEGIIAFPSFHAALGVLFMAAFWSVPFLRWPACLLNLGLIAATPLLGGHYFADVLAGIAAGLAALGLARGLAAWERGTRRDQAKRRRAACEAEPIEAGSL